MWLSVAASKRCVVLGYREEVAVTLLLGDGGWSEDLSNLPLRSRRNGIFTPEVFAAEAVDF